MGIVDYLSREPNGEPWSESEIDERFVMTSIENFQKALNCLNSRLIDTDRKVNVNILEYSGTRNDISHCKDNSSHGCYGNQFVPNWKKLDRNENSQSSSFQGEQNKKNTLNKISRTKQSVINSDTRNCNKSTRKLAITVKMEKNQSGSGKSKKLVKIANRQNEEREELTEQVTETTFSRTRMVKRGACSRQDSDSSDPEVPPIEWRAVDRFIKPKRQTETSSASPLATKLVSFCDLMGAERTDNPRSMLELEAQTVMKSRAQHVQELDMNAKGGKPPIVEVDLIAESPSDIPEVSVIGKNNS